MTQFFPDPEYIERRAKLRSDEIAERPLAPAVSEADRRRAQARREIENRRIEREAQQQ
ncbi:hypothetical protein [Chromobacterium violaceum]|uniref:hypothetical protein n=1 Tax=Chromobacterium violaceum TaxID=536 RepID=UPI001950B251|nr:hypothetical protein [Chromobacterium violaceum]QRO34152.1 hypothetical protein I6K04_05250 [Chromobacterium violaceum]QRQ16045.1 hypothetical protein I6K03_17480 [Chromobacterium violaceum]